jgi:hypothetical protein
MEELHEGWAILIFEVRKKILLGLHFLNDKVGTDKTEKEPKSTSGQSCLEPHETLNVIDSPNFRCFVGLSCCGSGFLRGSLPALPSEVALKHTSPLWSANLKRWALGHGETYNRVTLCKIGRTRPST